MFFVVDLEMSVTTTVSVRALVGEGLGVRFSPLLLQDSAALLRQRDRYRGFSREVP
jgi:hypothetical protein